MPLHPYSPRVAYVREMDFKLPMRRDYLGERINNDTLCKLEHRNAEHEFDSFRDAE